ncbi:uncharacterized protein ACNLHF_015060 [Anomaloglossus baeobatrachus]
MAIICSASPFSPRRRLLFWVRQRPLLYRFPVFFRSETSRKKQTRRGRKHRGTPRQSHNSLPGIAQLILSHPSPPSSGTFPFTPCSRRPLTSHRDPVTPSPTKTPCKNVWNLASICKPPVVLRDPWFLTLTSDATTLRKALCRNVGAVALVRFLLQCINKFTFA